jgi:hypothetical protein
MVDQGKHRLAARDRYFPECEARGNQLGHQASQRCVTMYWTDGLVYYCATFLNGRFGVERWRTG